MAMIKSLKLMKNLWKEIKKLMKEIQYLITLSEPCGVYCEYYEEN